MSIFTIGHDKMFRPIVYIYTSKIKHSEVKLFEECISFYYLLIQTVLFREYFIENMILILDLEGMGFLNFPYKATKGLINSTGITYSGRLHKILFVNPTFMFYGVWKILSSFLHPDIHERIAFISSHKHNHILNYINKDQLLEKYGGTMQAPTSAFPIYTTFKENEVPLFDETENTYFPKPKKIEAKKIEHKKCFFGKEMDVS